MSRDRVDYINRMGNAESSAAPVFALLALAGAMLMAWFAAPGNAPASAAESAVLVAAR